MTADIIQISRNANRFISVSVLLYGVFILIKVQLWIFISFTKPSWLWLMCTICCESTAWVVWLLKQHGIRMGTVLLILPLVSTLYTIVPICLQLADIDVFPYSVTVVWRGMLMESLMITHLWLAIALFYSRANSALYADKLEAWLDEYDITKTGMWLFICVGFAIAVVYITNFYISGTSAIAGTRDRGEIYTTLETGKTWLMQYSFMCWLMCCVILWFTRRARSLITPLHIILAVLAFLLFMFAFIQTGNRRELVIFLVFTCLILVLKRKTKIIALICLVTIPALLYIGMSRTIDPEQMAIVDQITYYRVLAGEFIGPHFALLEHLSSPQKLWLGWSYIRAFGLQIPTFGLWTKPLSLTLMFARQYGSVGNESWAYSPLAECYANFGTVSVIVLPIILVASSKWLATLRYGGPIPFLVFICMSFDINRGEFATLIAQISLFVIITVVFLYVARISFPAWSTIANN